MLSGPETKIDIVVVDRKCLVEAVQFGKNGSPEQHASGGDGGYVL